MKIVVQRVKHASVKVDNKIVGKINEGFLVLLGVTHGDTKQEADYLVKKLCNLRIFEDENEKEGIFIPRESTSPASRINSEEKELWL